MSVLNHLFLILDGNRRWAKSRGLGEKQGHLAGFGKITMCANICLKNNIKYLTTSLISLANLLRSKEGVDNLFEITNQLFNQFLPIFLEKKVNVRFLKDSSYIPKNMLKTIEKVEKETKDNKDLFLMTMVCYDGTKELVHAAKSIAEKVQNKEIDVKKIDDTMFRKNMQVPSDIPDPDLIIRTGSRLRLSETIPYPLEYSELLFLDHLWPDVDEKILNKGISSFYNRTRTFGKLSQEDLSKK
jgi:undecaprenyl diphosphate synthase